MFKVISSTFDKEAPASVKSAYCHTLPILTTWDTPAFVSGHQATESIDYMMSLCDQGGEMRISGLYGVGKISNVVLNRFEPYLATTADKALAILRGTHTKEE